MGTIALPPVGAEAVGGGTERDQDGAPLGPLPMFVN